MSLNRWHFFLVFNTFGQNLEKHDAVLVMTKRKYQIKTLFMIFFFLSKENAVLLLLLAKKICKK